MGSRTQPDLHLNVEYEDLGAFLTDYAENIQHGGTFVTSHRQWEVGEQLKLTLTFPGLFQPIRLNGQVAWARIGQDPGIGVDFHFDEHRKEARRLEETVERLKRRDPTLIARSVKILVAEDNVKLFESIQDGLDRLTARSENPSVVFNCFLATDGANAIEVIENVPTDLLIVDVNLPVLDGDSLIRQCKDLLGPQFPVIAISGDGKEAERRALRAGADLFLAKPLRLRRVYDSIVELLGLTAPFP